MPPLRLLRAWARTYDPQVTSLASCTGPPTQRWQ
eukprot:CAMPEP_0204370716 /NCGR_PEP_ID=MMETSP0469-20131031/45955_1 /ASSEMBLY_ACC=CAM_ASM_000384 /TAXON_ID=2969 /ORGANISM="Oxyrrhis marina" /LENGTH=33 /DNA_ID= /DNA_START= /DNA_END= /DNA_ORIENTATION=